MNWAYMYDTTRIFQHLNKNYHISHKMIRSIGYSSNSALVILISDLGLSNFSFIKKK